MSNKTITADDGTKYELTPTYGDNKPEQYSLKPVQAIEEKRGLTVVVWHELDNGTGDSKSIYELPEIQVTNSQATALAAAISSLIVYVQEARIANWPMYEKLANATDEAVKAFQSTSGEK